MWTLTPTPTPGVVQKLFWTSSRRANDKLRLVQDSGSLAVFKVTARDQGHYKGPSGAFVTYCNISCSLLRIILSLVKNGFSRTGSNKFCKLDW